MVPENADIFFIKVEVLNFATKKTVSHFIFSASRSIHSKSHTVFIFLTIKDLTPADSHSTITSF